MTVGEIDPPFVVVVRIDGHVEQATLASNHHFRDPGDRLGEEISIFYDPKMPTPLRDQNGIIV